VLPPSARIRYPWPDDSPGELEHPTSYGGGASTQMSEKAHCPHMTAEVCSVCQDLAEAKELLSQAASVLSKRGDPGFLVGRIRALLRKK
jgi:hypothetical protein